jgi:hypothetical protein
MSGCKTSPRVDNSSGLCKQSLRKTILARGARHLFARKRMLLLNILHDGITRSSPDETLKKDLAPAPAAHLGGEPGGTAATPHRRPSIECPLEVCPTPAESPLNLALDDPASST